MSELEQKIAITERHLAVYSVIANHSDKFITRKQIIADFKRRGDDLTDRELTQIIYDLVVKYDYPIGSTSTKRGYFIIKNEDDRRIALKELTSRVLSTNKRIQSLRNLNKFDSGG